MDVRMAMNLRMARAAAEQLAFERAKMAMDAKQLALKLDAGSDRRSRVDAGSFTAAPRPKRVVLEDEVTSSSSAIAEIVDALPAPHAATAEEISSRRTRWALNRSQWAPVPLPPVPLPPVELREELHDADPPVHVSMSLTGEANWLLLLPEYMYGDMAVKVRWPGGRSPEKTASPKKVDVLFSVGGSGGFLLPI
jgi:hypothetical protein